MFKETPIQIYMKPSTGGGYARPTRREKMYNAHFCLYVYGDDTVEVIKNKTHGRMGEVELDKIIPIFSNILANAKLKNTNLDMFKEGLSKLLQESINNTLKGDYYERAICTESARNGSNCDRGT